MSVTYAEKSYCAVNGAERTGWGKQFGMRATPTLRLTRKPFLQMSAHESWAKYWLEMAARRRDLPEFEFAEIIEVDSLTMSIESISQGWLPDFKQEFSPHKRSIDRLFEGSYRRALLREAKVAAIGESLDYLTCELRDLQRFYTLRRASEVREFLINNSFLFSLLREAYEQVRNYFGQSAQITLEVVTDPEATEDQELVVFIRTHFSPHKAFEKLEQFDEEWWLHTPLSARKKLCITVEFTDGF